ncbi:hypothetical protein K402DRAFT_453051 [Aulographum hederae CBS 113979]|uniref:Uncharacterized protein n=1 Tax=Aulographum hederae CBS 113979 TaxID=1176131 RepID=A0A6G1H5T9_9PEZI|nr:hypothetical protein K402DRAFT_453051 [Aulographum hederae CBS 113979]
MQRSTPGAWGMGPAGSGWLSQVKWHAIARDREMRRDGGGGWRVEGECVADVRCLHSGLRQSPPVFIACKWRCTERWSARSIVRSGDCSTVVKQRLFAPDSSTPSGVGIGRTRRTGQDALLGLREHCHHHHCRQTRSHGCSCCTLWRRHRTLSAGGYEYAPFLGRRSGSASDLRLSRTPGLSESHARRESAIFPKICTIARTKRSVDERPGLLRTRPPSSGLDTMPVTASHGGFSRRHGQAGTAGSAWDLSTKGTRDGERNFARADSKPGTLTCATLGLGLFSLDLLSRLRWLAGGATKQNGIVQGVRSRSMISMVHHHYAARGDKKEPGRDRLSTAPACKLDVRLVEEMRELRLLGSCCGAWQPQLSSGEESISTSWHPEAIMVPRLKDRTPLSQRNDGVQGIRRGAHFSKHAGCLTLPQTEDANSTHSPPEAGIIFELENLWLEHDE